MARADDRAVPAADLRFGASIASVGDVNSDGTNDVAIGIPVADGGKGEVLLVSGADGSHIYRVPSPFEPTDSGAPPNFGSAVAQFGDVSTCSGSPGGDCGNKLQSPDGFPEFLVAASGADVTSGGGLDHGRVYVIDGETGAIANRIMLAPDDLPLGSTKAEFGYSVLSPGDVVGADGKPDIAIGAPGYTETDSTYCPAAVCTQAGRVYVYSAADLSNHATSPVQTPSNTIDNPFAQDDALSQRFGHSLVPLPDIGQCVNPGGDRRCLGAGPDNTPSSTPDGVRDFLASMPLLDQAGAADAGAAVVIDGATGLMIKRINAVDPQPSGRFGAFSYQPPAAPDMGGSPGADLVIGAPQHGTGRAFVIDGDVSASATLSTLTDPAPVDGGGFGMAAAGIASGFSVGAPLGARAGTVRLFDASRALTQTICDPDGQPTSEFGASIANLGDQNGDGFDDFAVGAPGFDHPSGAANAGRVYLLTSSGPPAGSAPDACAATGAGTPGGGAGSGTGGGAKPAPPGGGQVVQARVKRRLVLRASPKRVRKFKVFRLSGKLSASARRNVCQRNQKVALQRRKGSKFQTFELAYTRKNGKFTLRAIAERTYVYRARVPQTARCRGAVSKTAKVSILRRRGLR